MSRFFLLSHSRRCGQLEQRQVRSSLLLTPVFFAFLTIMVCVHRCPGILKYIKSVHVGSESSEKAGFWNTMTISIISVVGAVVLATLIVVIALAATGKFKHKKNNEAFVVPSAHFTFVLSLFFHVLFYPAHTTARRTGTPLRWTNHCSNRKDHQEERPSTRVIAPQHSVRSLLFSSPHFPHHALPSHLFPCSFQTMLWLQLSLLSALPNSCVCSTHRTHPSFAVVLGFFFSDAHPTPHAVCAFFLRCKVFPLLRD